jgi:hypothetical protein
MSIELDQAASQFTIRHSPATDSQPESYLVITTEQHSSPGRTRSVHETRDEAELALTSAECAARSEFMMSSEQIRQSECLTKDEQSVAEMISEIYAALELANTTGSPVDVEGCLFKLHTRLANAQKHLLEINAKLQVTNNQMSEEGKLLRRAILKFSSADEFREADIDELKSQIRATYATNQKLWEREAEQLQIFAKKHVVEHSDYLLNALTRIGPAIDIIQQQFEALPNQVCLEALEGLHEQTNSLPYLQKIGKRHQAISTKQTLSAATVKRKAGEKLRNLVLAEATALALKPPVSSRIQAAELIAAKVSRSPDRVLTLLKQMKLFGRK